MYADIANLKKSGNRKSPILAVLWTLLFGVGFGHMYVCRLGRGLIWLAILLGGKIALAMVLAGNPALSATAGYYPWAINALAAVDALALSRREGIRPQPYNIFPFYVLGILIFRGSAFAADALIKTWIGAA